MSSRNQSANQLVKLEKPVYGGACLAHVEGRAVFVPLTLPGEEARIRIAQSKSTFAEAEAEEIMSAAAGRVEAACPHFGSCGGCAYQHADYSTQLEMKQAILRETLQRAGVEPPEQIETLNAEPWGYRNRIRLAMDAAGNPGYRGRRSHAVTPVRECPIAAPLLVESALILAEVAKKTAPSLKATEIALFANGAPDQLLLTVLTASARKLHFEELCAALKEKIPTLHGAELAVEDRRGGLPHTIARWGESSLRYTVAGFDYRVDHGAFFQVNRWLLEAMVEHVVAKGSGKLAWDLYAGVGLFARQLTRCYERVIAVESAPCSTQALAANLKGTRSAPVRATTLDFLRKNNSGEKFQRPDRIVVDPPRAGLGAEVCSLLAKIAAPEVVYVSCDPATLARDLRMLIDAGYAIHSFALADLFPQTHHMESIVHLRRGASGC